MILLTQELLPVPDWFDSFFQMRQAFNRAQREFNPVQQETNQRTNQRLNGIGAVPASRMAGMNWSPSKPLGTEVCRASPPC